MSIYPRVNTDAEAVADRAKFAYAAATQLIAETQYRLAELTGTGQVDPDESMALQCNLFEIWETLYYGTTSAVRDWAPTRGPGTGPITPTAMVGRC